MELRLFLMIVGNACYKGGVQVAKSKVILDKGQWLRSQRKLQSDLGASPNTINRAINWLTEKNLIKVKHIRLGTIFTVHNFHIYQGNERYPLDNALPVPLSEEERESALRYREDNANRYREDNNTNKELTNKLNKSNNLYNLNSVKNIKGVKHNERDTTDIEWERYNFKF